MNLWTLHSPAAGGIILAWCGSLPIDIQLLWMTTFILRWNISALVWVVSYRLAAVPNVRVWGLTEWSDEWKTDVNHKPWPLRSPGLLPVDHLWEILDWCVRRQSPPKWCPGPPAELQSWKIIDLSNDPLHTCTLASLSTDLEICF